MKDDEFTKLFKIVVDIQQDVRDVKENMTSKVELKRIYNQLDEIRGLLDTNELERAAQTSLIDRHEEILDSHETRLAKLEDQTA